MELRYKAKAPKISETVVDLTATFCNDNQEVNLKESWGNISAKEMTNRFWKATVTGGFCTHGEVLLDENIQTKEEQDSAVLWWAKGGKLNHTIPETSYFGHCGDEVYLFYYGDECCARVCPELPEGHSFTMEIVDARNMTREVVCHEFQNGDELRLPGHENMAVIAWRNKEV